MTNRLIMIKCIRASVFLILLSLVSDNLVLADTKFFRSVPTTVKTFENDSALLPCYPSISQYRSIRWNFEDFILLDSHYPEVKHDRAILHQNGSLEVFDLQLNDTGEYICEVETNNGNIFEQKHAIEVQYAPSVITYPTGLIERELKTIFEIVCEARGVPHPIIYWRHNGRNVSNTYDNNRRLLIDIQDYEIAGPIECLAENGVGDPVPAGITLLVLFVPEIKVNKSVIHTKAGMRAKLDCTVHAYPQERVHWFFEGNPIVPNNRMSRQEIDLNAGDNPTHFSRKVHSLIINNVQENNLGQYECRAENRLGYRKANITLTGKPMASVFKTHTVSTPTTQDLVWQTESLSPITDYKLKFLQLQTGNVNHYNPRSSAWKEITIPAEVSEGPIHTKGYTLRGLAPGSVYEVMIQSRNRYGWSDISKVLRFATPSEVDILNFTPVSTDFTDIQYNEEEFNENDLMISSYYSHSPSISRQFSNIILIVNLFVMLLK